MKDSTVIHVSRNGHELGTFLAPEVVTGLRRRLLNPDDCGWCEGMQEWKPLSALFPPPFPKPLAIIGGVLVALLLVSFVLSKLLPSPPERSDPMPVFSLGEPTQEDFQRAAEWLLEQDRKRAEARRQRP